MGLCGLWAVGWIGQILSGAVPSEFVAPTYTIFAILFGAISLGLIATTKVVLYIRLREEREGFEAPESFEPW